ncbi:amino acid ABC transporter substrate-binding protein [Hydrococcus rivularis NIES-593]|uniref:Amino acid ABC transporter substrate-binding protein n=1 Tax=Hydrococcus rivularis NIES-593 TaxID=1921803 RepID=A0A1U7HDC0_9CYAN|nr:ABC transporter substrate-binding protein [Hydrococcus rivularis]OKH21576.1 amino acid ABC transporter substrate-binding protein [Hydrococcus rivularis NIES-593]
MSQTQKNRRVKSPLALTLAIATLTTSFLTTACDTSMLTEGGGAPPASPGASPDAATGSGEGLKLGALLPITGDLASIGQNMPDAAKLAVDTINACGGVNGKPVTLIAEDDQTDPAAGAAAMTKLAESDRVAGVIGSFASSVSGAAVDIAIQNKIMLVSPGSTSPVFTERAQKGELQGYWARTAPPDTYQAQALAALANKKGFKNVGTVVINNDYGVGFEQSFIKSFEKQGGKITDKSNPVRYDPKAATLDSEAAAAFAGKPDAVAAVLYAETGSLLLEAAYKQGLTEGVTLLLTDGVYSEDFVKSVGKTSDGKSIISGALGTVPGADGKALANFTQLWKEKTGKEVTAYVPHTWDAAVLLMLAAQAAKTNTGEGIKSKIREVAGPPGTAVTDACQAIELVKKGEDIDYQGASGNVDIDEYGDVVGNYDVWTVKDDGTLEIIDKVSPAQ